MKCVGAPCLGDPARPKAGPTRTQIGPKWEFPKIQDPNITSKVYDPSYGDSQNRAVEIGKPQIGPNSFLKATGVLRLSRTRNGSRSPACRLCQIPGLACCFPGGAMIGLVILPYGTTEIVWKASKWPEMA